MSGRHEQLPGPRVGARWLVGVASLLIAALLALVLTPAAGAAATTVKTQLSLTGLASADNPLGGSVIGIHPGDKVSFTTATAPTAGLEKLGLDSLLGNLLNGLLGFQSKADFSKLPGGKVGTIVKTNTAVTFSFPNAGTYNFTWEVQKLQLLGGAVDINLDGNQLAKAGVKLNASNQYVGQIVVATNPPKGGLSIQLPGVKLSPKIGPIQLPEVNVPGVTLPTIKASVPNLAPKKKGAAKAPSKPADPLGSYVPPGLSVPDQVVPRGAGDAVGGGGGLYLGGVPGNNSQLGNGLPGLAGSSNSRTGGSASNGKIQDSTGKDKTIDLASQSGKPSSQLPIVLAILAIIALALVAGTYARLFLMGRNKTV